MTIEPRTSAPLIPKPAIVHNPEFNSPPTLTTYYTYTTFLLNSQILKHEGSTVLIPMTEIGHNPELPAFSQHRPFSLKTILLFNSLIIRTQSFYTTNIKAQQRI